MVNDEIISNKINELKAALETPIGSNLALKTSESNELDDDKLEERLTHFIQSPREQAFNGTVENLLELADARPHLKEALRMKPEKILSLFQKIRFRYFMLNASDKQLYCYLRYNLGIKIERQGFLFQFRRKISKRRLNEASDVFIASFLQELKVYFDGGDYIAIRPLSDRRASKVMIGVLSKDGSICSVSHKESEIRDLRKYNWID